MNKKFIFPIFACFLFLAGLTLVVAQYALGSEVIAIYLFNAAPLPNNCLAAGALPNPCFDSDGGYNPPVQGSFAGEFTPMNLTSPPSNPYWLPIGPPICFSSVGNEVCDVGANILNEVVCGHDVGIPNGAIFTTLTGQVWGYPGYPGEPAALVKVDCATFAANNPTLGLLGTCSAGACI